MDGKSRRLLPLTIHDRTNKQFRWYWSNRQGPFLSDSATAIKRDSLDHEVLNLKRTLLSAASYLSRPALVRIPSNVSMKGTP